MNEQKIQRMDASDERIKSIRDIHIVIGEHTSDDYYMFPSREKADAFAKDRAAHDPVHQLWLVCRHTHVFVRKESE